MSTPTFHPGLEGIIAAETRLSHVDGEAGRLIIAGYALEDVAPHASFEEVVFLLWQDRLPTAAELEQLRQALAARRALPEPTLTLLRAAAAAGLPAMDALRLAIDSLAISLGAADLQEQALRLVAAAPTIVAAYWRLRQGLPPLAPTATLSHAANYLFMLDGVAPSAERVRALETYLNTVADHGLNASTFTARVIISTASDLVSAITGAIGALKGPLHGGAPGPALETVFEIGTPERAEAVLRAKLAAGERLMGFGHRVYRVRDPRADVLQAAAERLYATAGDQQLYALARHIENVALALLAEHKPGRRLQTNVEFYTALLLHGLGLDQELFSPTFAVSRLAGWTAHCFEQHAHNRIIRPASAYVGPQDRRWTPLEARG